MTAARALRVVAAGPSVTVQDEGRRGTLSMGLSVGGAADRNALAEAAALLGQGVDCAALECPLRGGVFEAEGDLRIALTGAPMAARIDGAAVAWNASHMLRDGQVLDLGGVRAGIYGYLSVGGGFDAPLYLGSRSTQPGVGLGKALDAGDVLPLGIDGGGPTGRRLPVDDRFAGGEVRVVPGPQSGLFDRQTRERFFATPFTRDVQGNRQGVRLAHDGAPFAAQGGLSVLSDAIVPGDIQMTGEGTPFVLLPDSQTTGGYPRIGTVIPPDLPVVAQAPPGAILRFTMLDHDTGLAETRRALDRAARLAALVESLLRDPADMADLLAQQLISGVTAGHDEGEACG